MTTHELKTIDPYFGQVAQLKKMYEFRKDDRGFAVGDLLLLRQYAPDRENPYTGAEILREVVSILRHESIDGYCIMSIIPYFPECVIRDEINMAAMFDKYAEHMVATGSVTAPNDLFALSLLSVITARNGGKTKRRLISAAEHDIFYIDVDMASLATCGISEREIAMLVECGVRYDASLDTLYMYT